MMMMRSLFALLLTVSTVSASTRVAVIEFNGNKGPAVRRTTATDSSTTVAGVSSFWNALHQTRSRSLQHAGMTVVPDLFGKVDSGIVIGVKNVDLDSIPALYGLLNEESGGVVGHLDVYGEQLDALLGKVDSEVEIVDIDDLVDKTKKHCHESGLTTMMVEDTSVGTLDSSITSVLQGVRNIAEESGKTIVVHLVVEEDSTSSRRRQLSRRLDENANEDQGEQGDNGEDNNNQDQNNQNQENQNQNNQNQNNQNQNGKQQENADGTIGNVYYGFGYYKNGEFVTPYKTMFQIQYFNIVLWTSVGLLATLFITIQLMMYMPLEPDTLLFGQSAKLAGEE